MIGFERCQAVQKIKSEKYIEKKINNKDFSWPKFGKINFINYSTCYRPDTPIILKNINLNINSSEKIGIVGRTGSGKSSLILALARIIEPKEGKILIDDIDIQNLNLDELRQNLSIVPQDPFIIEGTLKENIDLLNKYNDEKILKLLDDFCLFKNLNNKQRLEFKIQESGKNLSSGEKQLICFARAVAKNNKIVLLDEATSTLDVETENIINENMGKYLKNCTVLFITHHIQMVKDCQKIIVIDKGEIKESGNYQELLKDKNSIFSSLYHETMNS